jgi:hypothetical protein
MGEDVPDAFAAPVFVDRAFDLIARRRRTPHEVGGNAPSSAAAGLGRTTLPEANRLSAAASNPRRGTISIAALQRPQARTAAKAAIEG